MYFTIRNNKIRIISARDQGKKDKQAYQLAESLNNLCKIKVNDENEKTFTLSENKKFSGSSSCLTPAVSNYYLAIKESCLDDNFTISCDKKFISTLSSGIYFK